jgi:signal transduction histidine kinase
MASPRSLFICLLLGSMLTGLVAWSDYRQSIGRHNAQLARELEHVGGTIKTTMERYLTLILSLEALVHANRDLYGDAPEERKAFGRRFDDFAGSLAGHNPSIESLQLAPGGVILYMTNAENNAKALGHDLLTDDIRREQVLDTIERRSVVVSGPLTLIQGGEALIIRKAIFTEAGAYDAERIYATGRAAPDMTWPRKIDSDFWGFATLVIGLEQLYHDLSLVTLPDKYRYALRGRHGMGAEGGVFWGDEDVFTGEGSVATIPLPDGSWQLGIEGSGTMLLLRAGIIVAVGLLLTLLATFAIYSHRARTIARAEGEARTRFLAAMSHEIRTPMNGIIGVAELLSATQTSDRQQNLIDRILANSKLLLRLVNDVLDFAKIDSGAMKLQTAAFSPRQVVVDALALVEVDAAAKNLSLSSHIDDGVPQAVMGDDIRVKQILVNLLGNAVKFTESGTVSLSVDWGGSAVGTELRFTVKDSGIGIPEKVQKRLFEPFSQVSREAVHRQGGTGLGLVISRQLAQMMGGDISVSSDLGRGSTFTLLLPVSVAEQRVPEEICPHEIGDVEASVRSSERPMRILIVDDVEMNVEIAADLLESLGYKAEGVGSGAEAIARVKERAYDVILMDRQMPGMDGIETTRKIRALTGSAIHPWVIAMTASAREDEKHEYLEAGANDFMAKPIDSATLRQKMEAVGW